MKVVLFCGGLGMRLREYSETLPKPMVPIGHQPILLHLMKYYAHFGHTDFILCLGHRGNAIKEYFLNYDACLSNDFVLGRGGAVTNLHSSDIQDWNITFIDTGQAACIGQRLLAVRHCLEDEDTFLANYADGLSDLELPTLIDFHHQSDATATFLAVQPRASFHAVQAASSGRVESLQAIDQSGMWINGGFFVLQNEVFDYLHEGEELVLQAFDRLIEERRLCCLKHRGFWGCMDTYKEKQEFDDMHAKGDMPWALWEASPGSQAEGRAWRSTHADRQRTTTPSVA